VRRGRLNLGEGEQFALQLRRHCYTLAGPALVLLICAGGGAFLVGTVPDTGGHHLLRLLISAAIALVALRWAVWPFLVWYATSWLLTTQRLIICEGVLSGRGTDVPLGRITGVGSTRSLLQRLCGAGRLSIVFAGGYAAELYPAGQPGHGLLVIDDLPLLNEVQPLVAHLVDSAPRIAFLPPPAPPSGPDPALPDLY
jgi:membrane protein YdbS with pleckstrin-like domain